MRVGLFTWGTEGDVRPFFTLARALSARGHTCRVEYVPVEGRAFDALARGLGIDASPLGLEYFTEHREELAKLAKDNLELNAPPEQFERIISDVMDPVVEPMLERSLALAEQSDVVVAHFLAHPMFTAVERVGRPFVSLALSPIYASKHYPPSGVPSLGRLLNPLLWKLANHIMSRTLAHRINAQRAKLGLAPIPRFDPRAHLPRQRTVVAVSPSLFARPADWDPRITVDGSLSVPEAAEPWEPEPALAEFLAAAPPVFASFGSMFNLDERMTHDGVERFVGAAERAEVPMVIQCPRAVLERAPRSARVRYIERAPHGRLFPRCSLIVHHGGAGTTQSALLAGRPSVVVPHVADQFYWGDLLHSRGVASRPVRRHKLTAKNLADRIRWVLARPALAQNAQQLGAALRAEDGPNAIAAIVEQTAAAQP